MAQGRCWSSIVASPADRTALRLDHASSWPVPCELADGHPGTHAGDGGRGFGRRPWLVWGDFALAPYACREQDPCPASSPDRAPCRLFGGHSGPHRFPEPVRPLASVPPARHVAAEAAADVARRDGAEAVQRRGDDRWAPGAAALDDWRTGTRGSDSGDWRGEGPTVSKKVKKKHRWHDDDELDGAGASTRAAAPDSALSPMVEVRGYSDMTRSSLVEVVQPDGSTRIVLMPVAGDDTAARRTVTSMQAPLSELEKQSVAAVAATATETVSAATRVLGAAGSGAVSDAGESTLVRHQVGEALREVAASLSKLADSLDPH